MVEASGPHMPVVERKVLLLEKVVRSEDVRITHVGEREKTLLNL